MKKYRARWLSAGLLCALAGCGGGGGGDASTPVTLPQGTGAIAAGVYRAAFSNSASTGNSELIVHPEGRIAGSHAQVDIDGLASTRWQLGFAGTTTPSSMGAASDNAPFHAAESRFLNVPEQGDVVQSSFAPAYGSADVTLVAEAGGAVRAELTEVSVPTPRTTFALQRAAATDIVTGLTLQRLAGSYNDGTLFSRHIPNGWSTTAVIDGAGTVTGEVGTGCALAGRVHALDGASGVFRLSGSLAGAGCKGTAGAIEFVGYIGRQSNQPEAIILVARGMAANQVIHLGLYERR